MMRHGMQSVISNCVDGGGETDLVQDLSRRCTPDARAPFTPVPSDALFLLSTAAPWPGQLAVMMSFSRAPQTPSVHMEELEDILQESKWRKDEGGKLLR